MQVTLDQDVVETIKRIQSAGAKGSIEQIANRALRLNLDAPELMRRHHELKRSILEAAESMERGEFYDADEVFDEVLREIDERIRS
jgi:hypothetical protein